MYIIKQETKVEGKIKTLFFNNITVSTNKTVTNVFVPHWYSDIDNAKRFFDLDEAKRFAAMLHSFPASKTVVCSDKANQKEYYSVNALTNVSLDEEETLIDSVSTDQTGGHIYNDVIRLKNGMIIRISEDLICIYDDDEKDQEGTPITFAEIL